MPLVVLNDICFHYHTCNHTQGSKQGPALNMIQAKALQIEAGWDV